MKEVHRKIRAGCSRYACRVCRTKTGWPHQVWCELARRTTPGCGDCRYWSEAAQRCAHPSLRKGGGA